MDGTLWEEAIERELPDVNFLLLHFWNEGFICVKLLDFSLVFPDPVQTTLTSVICNTVVGFPSFDRVTLVSMCLLFWKTWWEMVCYVSEINAGKSCYACVLKIS